VNSSISTASRAPFDFFKNMHRTLVFAAVLCHAASEVFMKHATTTAAFLTLLVAASASATKHTVTQSGFSFSPASITVAPGDTVRFVRTGGNHTVTSGANCTASGLFNAPLSASSTSFVWTVPASAAGTTVPYYCIPHCGGGMVGQIVVVAPPPSPDLDGDGFVNAADLASLLAGWGNSGPTDLDRDGSTGASDLAALLAAWTG
jgi:plastocyanin